MKLPESEEEVTVPLELLPPAFPEEVPLEVPEDVPVEVPEEVPLEDSEAVLADVEELEESLEIELSQADKIKVKITVRKTGLFIKSPL